MYDIIPLAIICFSILVILIIIVRKFPAIAALDVENIPAEKEARFKEKIISSRLERNLAKWRIRLVKVFRFLGEKIAVFFRWAYDKLREAKKNYSQEKAPLTVEDKDKKIKDLFIQGEELDDKENFEDKEKSFIKIIELEPRNTEAFRSLGALYFTNKKYEEAKQAWAHVLKLLPDAETDKQADVYHDLALLYEETGDKEAALETIKMAAKLSPNSPRYLDALAEISIMNKDKISAEEALVKLSEVNPENGKIADFREQIKSLE